MERKKIGTGTPWESEVGYSRAVRVGPWVFVAGTTATDENGQVVAPYDPHRQTQVALENVAAALERVGASLADVVRTRLFVTDIARWEDVGRAHGEFFADVRPATTMVEVSALVDPRMCVEVEAQALVSEGAS